MSEQPVAQQRHGDPTRAGTRLVLDALGAERMSDLRGWAMPEGTLLGELTDHLNETARELDLVHWEVQRTASGLRRLVLPLVDRSEITPDADSHLTIPRGFAGKGAELDLLLVRREALLHHLNRLIATHQAAVAADTGARTAAARPDAHEREQDTLSAAEATALAEIAEGEVFIREYGTNRKTLRVVAGEDTDISIATVAALTAKRLVSRSTVGSHHDEALRLTAEGERRLARQAPAAPRAAAARTGTALPAASPSPTATALSVTSRISNRKARP
ncbi:hypothetical protein [Streptacidiphilus sp. MAP5-52]|uniref:hypothetical protein n=1 Tax=Streptacidiphilus sp. MAP5-52 TaxID=3156267 RepID=UPI0035149F15